MSRASQLGIMCGLEFEADVIRRRVRHEGLADRILVRAGMGRDRARAAAENLIANGATALLSFGLAGGLDPSLGRGTIVVGTSIKAEQLPSLACAPDWSERLLAALEGARRGDLAHAPDILATRIAKSKLYTTTRGLAADMESYGAGEAANAANVPFAALRVIADTAAEDLPEVALQAMAPDSSLKLVETLGRIVRSPRQIPSLIKLGRATEQARRRLDEIAAVGTEEIFFSAPR